MIFVKTFNLNVFKFKLTPSATAARNIITKRKKNAELPKIVGALGLGKYSEGTGDLRKDRHQPKHRTVKISWYIRVPEIWRDILSDISEKLPVKTYKEICIRRENEKYIMQIMSWKI